MPGIFRSGVIKQSLFIGQRLPDYIALQPGQAISARSQLQRFVEPEQFHFGARGVFEQVALPGLRIAPALRPVAVNDGDQQVALLDDDWRRHLKKDAPVFLRNRRFDLLRFASNPVCQFVVDRRELSRRRSDHYGQIGRVVAVEVSGDEILGAVGFDYHGLIVDALDRLLRLSRLRRT